MYDTILMPLDASPSDRPIIEHVRALAAAMQSKVVVLHVLTGAQAQWHGQDAGGEKVEQSRAYLASVQAELERAGIPVRVELVPGEPAKEIVRWVEAHGCDLVAMGTHGHRWLGDMFLGFTASKVQHAVSVPVLLLRSR